QQENPLAQPGANNSQLLAALNSPFVSDDVHVQLTSGFEANPQHEPFVRSVLQIDARDLTFAPEAGDWHAVKLDLIAQILSPDWQVVDHVFKTDTIRVHNKALPNLLRNGLPYVLNLPVKKAGAYQLRVAVRDVATGRAGSANQDIEVSDLKNNRLALSGIFFKAGDRANGAASTVKTAAQTGVSQAETRPSAARRFRQGAALNFEFTIYNARLDRRTGQPQLSVRLLVYKNGVAVYETAELLPDMNRKGDQTHLRVKGRVPADANLQPV